MLLSMTGYGKSEVVLSDKKIIIEVKALNSKNTDTNIKLPLAFREKELEIRQLISERLNRGKIDCIIYYEMNEGVSPVNINTEAVKNYYRELSRLAEELNVETGESLFQAVLRLPDIVKVEKPELEEPEWNEIRKGLESALAQLEQFRKQEGQAMQNDLKQRIEEITTYLKDLSIFEKGRIEKIREKIEKSLRELNLQDEIDRNRFEQELIYYMEKLDISEEKTRLLNHCRYFTETMNTAEAAGKKLSFISQEIGREINTIGSKANDSDIQHIVVKMKDELEKIKEQSLNIL